MNISSRSRLLFKTSGIQGGKPTKHKFPFIVAAVLLVRMASAQTLYWDPGAGGTGLWDNLTPNWSANSGGGANTTWTNGDIADFSASPVIAPSYTISLGGLETAGGLTFANGAATLTGGTLLLNGGGQVSVSASEGVIISPITGSAGLTKTGGGQLDLLGVNAFTGNLTNRAGTVTLDNDQAGGEGAIVLNPSASVILNSSLTSLTLTNNVEVLGSSSTAEIDAGTNNTIALGGVISGPHNWNANGPGFLVLSNANTFGGILTVAQGTLIATTDGALAGVGNDVIVSNNATLAFQGGFTYTGTKTVVLNGSGAGGGPALNSIAGDNTFYGPVVLATNSELGASAGSLELVGSITGPYNLVTTGDVAFGSSGNTYINTIVSQGDLYIEASSSVGTGSVTVDAGAVLEGISSVAAPGGVSLSGTISPGAGEPASFGTGLEIWNGGASFDWTLGDATGSAGVGYSTLNINGSLTINATSQPITIYIGSFNPDFDTPGPADDFDNTRMYTWTIATASGGITGFNPADFTVNTSGFENDLGGGRFRVLKSANELVVEFDPAPVINCPESIVTGNDLGECSANVYFAATATNYSSLAPVTIAYQTNGITITSPCVFPKGTTIVTSTATDAVGDTATCGFTVTVNDVQPPTITTCAPPQTIAANAETAKAVLPDITSEVIANDNCGGVITPSQVPPAGTIVNLGRTNVTVWASDPYGNSNSCSAIITVVYTNKPVLACAPDVTVTTTQDKDPYATGYPTVTDPDGPLTLTYSDNYTHLTARDSTGLILRTWTAEDASSNTATCTQTITVVDTNAPYFTYVPANITTTNDPGQCGALVSFGGAAVDLGYLQGFENPNWFASTNPPGSTLDWDEGNSAVYRVPSGSNDIASPNGVAYAVVDSSVPQAGADYSSSGAFTFLGGLSSWQFGQLYGYNGVSSAFGLGYRASLDVYINLSDPAVANATPTSGYAWDLSTSASGTQSNFLSDFVFHAAAYDASGVVIGAGTGSSDSAANRGPDLRTGAHATITSSGWYKFEWNFYSNSASALSVDMKVRDAGGAVLFAQTITNGTDVAQVDGHPNYMWFTFLALNQLPIANTKFERNEPVTSSVASGTLFPADTTTVTDTAMDACGNTTNTTFTVTVNDVEPPVIQPIANIVTVNDPGMCGAAVTFPTLTATDNCGIASIVATPPSGGHFDVGTTLVTVVATDFHGNTATSTFNVTVNDVEPPVITNAVDIVEGVDAGQTYATVNFTVGATHPCGIDSVSASWTGNSQSAAGGTLTVTGWKFPIGTNTVTVTATDVNHVTSTSTFTVAVIGLPQIVFQPESVTNNAGATATFVVTASSPATLTYQWFKDGTPLGGVGNILGTNQTLLQILNVSNSDEGTYYVQVSDIAGTVTSSNATLTVIDPPLTATIAPSSQTNDASSTAQFVVSAAGTPPFTYQWTKVTATSTNLLSDIGNIFGSTSNVLTISNLLGADQAEYIVTVSNPAGSDTTNALLFVNDPAILGQPSNVTNRLGGSATFSVTAAGTAPLSYQWQQDGVDLPGATSRTLTLNNIGDSFVGDYTVVVSNSVSEATSDIATLTVTHPPVITSQPANLTVNLGQNATFSVAVNGDTPFTYQWFQNGLPASGGNVSGGTTRQLIITDVMTSNGGTYYVAITNDVGQTISSNATLTVIVPPAITNQPAGLTNNAGSTATFAVGASGTTPAYQWYQITATATNKLTDNANITGSTSNVLTIAGVLGADDAYYMALASNQAGTAASSNALLVVIDPIITNEPSSVTANLGSPASFTVGAFGTSPQYQWYQNGNAIAGANGSTYSLASVVNTNAGNYTVVVSNIFGAVTSTPAVSLTVIDPPVIIGQPQSVTVSAGATAVFAVTNTGTSPTYQWYFGSEPLNNGPTVTGANGPILTLTQAEDANAGTYSVVLGNSAATVTSSNAVLTVIDPPVIAGLQPSSQTNNATATAQFTVNVTGTAPFTYQWTKITPAQTNILSDGGNIFGSTSNVLTVTNILAADQAEYLVKVSNSAGMALTNGTLVVIDPAIFAQPVGQTNFLGSTVTFSVTAAGTSPLNYQWLQNGSPLFGANSNILTLRNIADSDAGLYTVVIANSAGSATSAPAVLVTVSPLITQQPANAVVLAGQSASFSVSVNGELPFSYQWQFNGTNIAGATSRIYTIPSAQPANVGGYQVIVQNPAGTQVSQTATLSVGPAAFLTALPYNNGTFTLLVNGAPGHLYTVQGSTNFVIWFPIITNTTPFIFTNNSGYPFEFYRALFQQ
jgi:autotransporter-associated beta strand protein